MGNWKNLKRLKDLTKSPQVYNIYNFNYIALNIKYKILKASKGFKTITQVNEFGSTGY